MRIRTAAIVIVGFMIAIAQTAECQKRMKYSVVAIEYIGESDKPITPIVISDSAAGAEWYRRTVLKRNRSGLTYKHVVTGALLEKFITEAERFERTSGSEPREVSKSVKKAVSVTIITPERKNTFLRDTESAVLLLDRLQQQAEGDESLRADLLHFQNRIRPLRGRLD